MSIDRKIGLELRDGQGVGRDPDQMTAEELIALGHSAMSPLKALRLRCIDCCAGSSLEVRLCTAVSCPSWPFRLGRNPWRPPASEAQRAWGRRLAAMSTEAFLEKAENGGRDVLATTLPASTPKPLSPLVSVGEEEGA
jgi:hypothetical protein